MSDVIGRDLRTERGGATLVSGAFTTICGPYDLLPYGQVAFTVYNQGAYTLSGVRVQTNPDPGGSEAAVQGADLRLSSLPNPALWETLDETSLANIGAAGVETVVFQNNARRFWRLQGHSRGSDAIAVSGYLNAASV